MTAADVSRPRTQWLPRVPRRPDGRVDVEAVATAVRGLAGRLHRFDDATTGTTRFAVPEGAPAGSGAALPPGEPDAPPHDTALTAVLALPYAGAPFVDPIAATVTVSGDRVALAASDDLAAELTAAIAAAGPVPSLPPAAPRPVTASVSADRYVAAVRAALDAIAAGDVYVVNLALRLTTTWDGDVHGLGARLRAASPAPHAAVLELTPGTGLASVSPETFLRAEGRALTIRPIKGTRPRGATPQEDAAQRNALLASEKERAENVMIVDLERNDLGIVAEIGSVAVPELCVAEPHPTVWQLVSTVTARLRADRTYADALTACAPCGSVTGAPKRSAMATIARLETTPRGWYCGAFGWLAPGRLETAVTIRTAVLEADGTCTFGTGAGIVADSDPATEYAETLLKAAPFLAAVSGQLRSGGRD